MKTPKQIMFEALNGAKKITDSKLCWELTDRSREMLTQEIYHHTMKMVLMAQESVVSQVAPSKKKSVIIEKTGPMTWGMGGPK